MKPQKPTPEECPDFPLTCHDSGQYCKKKDGKTYYFGTEWRKALVNYQAWLAAPPLPLDTGSLRACADKYIESKRLLQQRGKITFRHLSDIERTLDKLCKFIGPTRPLASLKSEDYGAWCADMAKTNGAVSMGNHVMRVRAFLKWAVGEDLIAKIPPHGLEKPTAKELRKARKAQKSRLFESAEIQRLLKYASPPMRAMILLAVNAGMGNEDLALLKTSNVKDEWLDCPRVKTEVDRRVPLWPETIKALAAIEPGQDGYVFHTKYGNLWTIPNSSGAGSPISGQFAKLCQNLDLYKPRRGFYSLRHTCATIGEECGDSAAIEYILGHVPLTGDMGAVYRERMSDERLLKVTEHIRQWLLVPAKKVETLALVEV